MHFDHLCLANFQGKGTMQALLDQPRFERSARRSWAIAHVRLQSAHFRISPFPPFQHRKNEIWVCRRPAVCAGRYSGANSCKCRRSGLIPSGCLIRHSKAQLSAWRRPLIRGAISGSIERSTKRRHSTRVLQLSVFRTPRPACTSVPLR